MKKICILVCFLLCMTALWGCEDTLAQMETAVIQIDIEKIITEVIESIDWEELKTTLEMGYDSLTEKYPALKGENIKSFLKEHGLELLNKYVSSSYEAMQENARKLGEIIKILNPELTDEVDAVISQ